MEPEVWAICELMGHVKLAGRLTEIEMFGAKMGRLDIPQGDGFVTQLFGGGSVYRITIVSEDVARHVSRQTTPAPVSPWDFPARLEAPAKERDYHGGDYRDDPAYEPEDDEDEPDDDRDEPDERPQRRDGFDGL